jgi:leucyl-tRNA synthetase
VAAGADRAAIEAAALASAEVQRFLEGRPVKKVVVVPGKLVNVVS